MKDNPPSAGFFVYGGFVATEKDILADAREAFDKCVEAESENRAEALDDLRFAKLGEQWPDEVLRQRERDGRPCLTLNRMPTFIRQVVNDSRQNKPGIKVKAVDSNADVETADILSGLIRNIEYISNADVAYDTAIEFAVASGVGYLRVDMDYAHDDTFNMDVRILRVANPFAVYGDHCSEAADSSDWMQAFVVDQMRLEEFRKKWKGAEEVDWQESGYDTLAAPWYDGETLQVAEYWTREDISRPLVQLSDGAILDANQYRASKDYLDLIGLTVTGEREAKSWKVRQRIMTGAEVLEENDWPGIYIPIIPVYGDEMFIDGRRHYRSLIRDAKDAQRMLNYWRTTATELVALAPRIPFLGPRGAFSTDAAKWATANTVSHAFIEYDGAVPPQRQSLETGSAAGAMQQALAASDDMKAIIGIYDASLGNRSNETSGRAILARQREGDVSTFHFIDNLTRAIRHLGRVVVDLIPHVYSGQRILRVIGEDGASQTVEVNQQPDAQIQQQEGLQAVSRIYDLTTGRYDVVCESGPNFTTRREEAATQMVELIRAYPPAAPLIGDLLARQLDWPEADEIARRMAAVLPPQIQGENPEMQQAKQAMQAMQQQIQELGGKLAQANADHQVEARKLDIDAYNAETNRLKAVSGAGLSPEQVQALVLQTLQQVLTSPDVLPSAGQQGAPMPMQ